MQVAEWANAQPRDDTAPVILGALGGAVVTLAVGAERGMSLPHSVDSMSGVDPSPF